MPLKGKIPSMRIGRVWRFDKGVIDNWIGTGQIEPDTVENPKKKSVRKKPDKKKSGIK
jgi:hypothetical protein